MKNRTRAFTLKNALLAGVLAVSVTLAGCSAKSGGLLGGEKVATVNGTVITKAEYDKTYNEFTRAFGLDKMPKEQQIALTEMVKQMTMQKLIMKTLITDEAEKAGIKVADADVKKYKEEKIFSNPAVKEQFQAFLKQSEMKESDFDAMLRENLLISKFMEKQGGAQVQVTEAEAKAVYDKNKAQFKLPDRIHAEHILVKAIVPEMKKEEREKNPKITDAELDKAIAAKQSELKAKAEKLLQEVKKNPEKFAEVAKANSDDTASAERGGDLGFMTESTTDPQFWAALKKTPEKTLHPNVVSTIYGYHIMRVQAHSPAHQESFAEVREQLQEQLSQEKKQEFLKKWTEQKRNAAKIVIEPAYQPKEADPLASMPAPVTPQGKDAAPEQAKDAASQQPKQAAKH